MQIWNRWINAILQRLFELNEDIVVPLGESLQESMLTAVVERKQLWKDEPVTRKLLCLLRRHWEPREEKVIAAATRILVKEVFGDTEDFGDEIFDLMVMHSNLKWDFSCLTPDDLSRASALEAFSVGTFLRLSADRTIPPLNLQLARRDFLLCTLAFPMVGKIPVQSLRWFLAIHARFAFNEIRRSGHVHGDALVSFLYEILLLQQKTAIGLREYLGRAACVVEEKGDATLINAEVDAIMGADLVFPYLKASVEKTMSLIGYTHNIPDLDSKKDHKARLRALAERVPENIQQQGYYRLIMEFVKSESLEELNSYRTGLLHKRGIADLQPHNYVGRNARSLPFQKIYAVLYEQHANNTAVLLAALALLTDQLVRLVPLPNETVAALSELMVQRFTQAASPESEADSPLDFDA